MIQNYKIYWSLIHYTTIRGGGGEAFSVHQVEKDLRINYAEG